MVDMTARDEQDAVRVTAEEFDDGATSDLGDIETIDADITDKRIQYAGAGVPRYLIVRLDQKEERIEEIEEYRLDWSGRRYRAHDVHRRVLLLDDPVEATIPFDVLEQA
ncbi:hypothetical protein ACWCW7_24910 [Nocardia tengchongensis]